MSKKVMIDGKEIRITKSGNLDKRYKVPKGFDTKKYKINTDVKTVSKETKGSKLKKTFWQRLRHKLAIFSCLCTFIGAVSVVYIPAIKVVNYLDQKEAHRIRSVIRTARASQLLPVEVSVEEPRTEEEIIAHEISKYDWNARLVESIARWESSGYKCQLNWLAINDKYNKDGSKDYGLLQVNSETFKDFQRRRNNEMRELGITDYDQMLGMRKNIAMFYLIWKEQGYEASVAYKNGLHQTCYGSTLND